MPNAVHLIADSSDKLDTLRRILEKKFAVSAALLRNAPQNSDIGNVVVAADLAVVENISALKQNFARAKSSRKRIFVMDQRARLFVLQAYALGATDVMFNPVQASQLLGKLDDLPPPSGNSAPSPPEPEQAAAGGAAAISSMFAAVLSGKPIDVAAATLAAGRIADSVAEDGLSNWLDTVRQHHEGTYQHCLLVTGVAVDFGLALGLARADIKRLYSAAMFHDIGKAAIPAAILNKPGKLDPEERRLIETHPMAGYEALVGTAGISGEVLDAVRHHHEYLDGTGYPDQLSGAQIPDAIRILTISDIFAALIENRRYKPPMSRQQAFEVLLGMNGKLEGHLVKAFRMVALER